MLICIDLLAFYTDLKLIIIKIFKKDKILFPNSVWLRGVPLYNQMYVIPRYTCHDFIININYYDSRLNTSTITTHDHCPAVINNDKN